MALLENKHFLPAILPPAAPPAAAAAAAAGPVAVAAAPMAAPAPLRWQGLVDMARMDGSGLQDMI